MIFILSSAYRPHAGDKIIFILSAAGSWWRRHPIFGIKAEISVAKSRQKPFANGSQQDERDKNIVIPALGFRPAHRGEPIPGLRLVRELEQQTFVAEWGRLVRPKGDYREIPGKGFPGGLSVRELEKCTGISDSQVSRWRVALRVPGLICFIYSRLGRTSVGLWVSI
jgi:hypothetical protein